MAVFSSLHAACSLFPGLVRSRTSSEVRLFPQIIPASSFPAISLKLGSRQTAAIRRRLEPVQAKRRCDPVIDLAFAFYPHMFAQVLALLQALPDVRARCQQIERYGKQLSPVPTPFLTATNRVEGLPASNNTCIHAQLDPRDPSLVRFYAHSDAAHIRGLVMILTAGLSGSPVRTIADMPSAPFALLIGQSLLPARWCSHFMLLLEHMQCKARELITTNVDYNSKVIDVLNIMGLGSLHISLKDEIDKTHVVHELLSPIGLDMNDDDDCNDFHEGKI
uniref:Fe-S metabolism associated domain-containing protein n=1 Tax=Ananas comosus var. bracteatus TaxID=296719 RepID=A0A6V7QVG5_ANACO